jgi:His-Xaa-Ser system radical SAM maturase HxsC
MIPLRIRAETPAGEPFVVRLAGNGRDTCDARLLSTGDGRLEYATASGVLRLLDVSADDVAGDVLLVVPDRRIAHRLIRAKSDHNTLLVTEQCDQLCVMCSQPPKAHHVDLYPLLERAALLAPPSMVLGITGGEPTLHKAALFHFLDVVLSARPDLHFHILTNAQHFDADDRAFLTSIRDRVTWGIPLYSAEAATHDEIVKKAGAFERLATSLSLLARCGADIELRTVVMKPNAPALPALADFVTRQVPFISCWAIMQLENIGYGRMNWRGLFFDSSATFEPIGQAVDIAKARGLHPQLYNFPLCTVPAPYRPFAVSSISDWKRRYLASCDGCTLRNECGGFFEWHPEPTGYERLAVQ